MVERHAQGFPKHSGSTAPPSKDVILVTGTTGSLGTTLLAHLVASDDVLRIFAVNRKADGSTLLERQMTSMRHQGLDPGIASSKKVMLLEADLNKVAFGLPTSMYEAMREQVTHIIHNGVLSIFPPWFQLKQQLKYFRFLSQKLGESILTLLCSHLSLKSKDCGI